MAESGIGTYRARPYTVQALQVDFADDRDIIDFISGVERTPAKIVNVTPEGRLSPAPTGRCGVLITLLMGESPGEHTAFANQLAVAGDWIIRDTRGKHDYLRVMHDDPFRENFDPVEDA